VSKPGGLEWVVVRTVMFPATRAERPAHWSAIVANTARVSKVGHFASVALVSADQDFDRPDAPPHPLWRGHGMYVNYEGLE